MHAALLDGKHWLCRTMLACFVLAGVTMTGCAQYGGKTYPVVVSSNDADASLYVVRQSQWNKLGGATALQQGSLTKQLKPLPNRGTARPYLEGVEYVAIAERQTGSSYAYGWFGPFTPTPSRVVEILVELPTAARKP